MRYRCRACRVDLRLDRDQDKLTVAPVDASRGMSAPEAWGARNVASAVTPGRRKNRAR